MALPLRIRAERHSAAKFGEKQTFILPSKQEDEACLIIHDSGVVALVVSSQDSLNSQQRLCSLLGLNDSYSLPKYSLIIKDSSEGVPSLWVETSTGADAPKINKETMIRDAISTQDSSRVVVEAIERYYGRQVLEPSIRGFLSILEKQFPSNNLYLFELLQNAVDDGASIVKFKATDDGIVFMHDGREFTSMDVLGLASVGLSTKSSDRRSVGFMGIGFKAVYKRFAKVVVYDSKWKFYFEEPYEKSTIKPAHAWVMEPRWLKAPESALRSSSGSGGENERNWCHFELQKPRVPIKVVHEDLRRIPYSIPPLLGKQALKNFALEKNTSKSSWTLVWNRRKFVTQIAKKDINFEDSSRHNGGKVDEDNIGFQTVVVSEYAQGSSQLIEDRHWQFINLSFVPSASAQTAYLTHTKKAWSSGDDDTRREETSFFFQVDKQGVVVPNQTGLVHSILPTKVKLPTSMSWQGSWLLSVDRQEVVFDQEWNKCIASKAGSLLLGLLRWIAAHSSTENALYPSYSMLPPIVEESSSYYVTMLGTKTSVSNLILHMKREELVPCLPGESVGNVCYGRASEVIWLPPPFLNRLPSSLISSWFGTKIFPSNLLKEIAWSPLFTSTLPHVTQSLLYKRKSSFKIDKSLLSTSKTILQTAVSLLCAVSECLESCPPATEKKLDDKEREKSEISNQSKISLLQPDFASWPIFLGDDENNSLHTVNEIVIPSAEFVDLPVEIRDLLRSSLNSTESVCDKDHSKYGGGCMDKERDRSRKYSSTMSSSSSSSRSRTTYCLHPELEMMLLHAVSQPTHQSKKGGYKHHQRSCDHSSFSSTLSSSIQTSISRQDQQHLSKIYSTISSLAPESVISVDQCATALFRKWTSASAAGCDESVIKGCMLLFKYALQSREPSLIPYLLCKRPSHPDALFLSPASDVYLSEEYTGSCGAAIEAINAKMDIFQIIASNYHPHFKSNATSTPASDKDGRKQTSNRREIMATEQLLIAAGAQATIKVEATARLAKADDFSQTASGVAPKLRSTNTSSVFDLPYNLGTINRKHHYVLDVRLTREWEKIIEACRGDVSIAENVCLVVANALCNTDSAATATNDTSPALAPVLKGQAAIDRDSPMPLKRDGVTISTSQPIPAIQRLIFLPPGQPGASTEKLRPAAWIQLLKSRPWLPAGVTDSNACSGAISTMKPSEVRLDSKSDSDQTIPVASLPSKVLSLLQSMPTDVKMEFAFGTVKPRPPIERLVHIITKAADDCSRNVNDLHHLQEMCDIELYLELKSIWKAISSACMDGTLSRDDKSNILSSISNNPNALVFPHPTIPQCVYSIQRCVRIQQNSPESTRILCSIDYLLDLKDIEYHSLFPTSMLPASASQSSLDLFLNSVWKFSSEIKNTLHLRIAFTTCLASFVMHEYMRLGRRAGGNICSITDIREEDYSAILSKCRQKLPDLKIFCGHGPGPKGFDPRWRNVYRDGSNMNDSVLPVLIDDQSSARVVGSGFAKSSMLRMSHGYQPIMTLSPFTAKEHLAFQNLNEQNYVLLKILDIPRISDNNMFSLRTRNSGSPQFLQSETDRLHAVVLLLYLLSRKNSMGTPLGVEKAKIAKAIKVIRYESIELHFKTPKMGAAEVSNKHSVWGPPKLITEEEKTHYSGSILLAGDLIDYVADLEEMLVLRLNELYMNVNTKDARRALKLLSHIESNDSFLKIFDRDFKSLLHFDSKIDTDAAGDFVQTHIGTDEDDKDEDIETKLYKIINKLRSDEATAKSKSNKRSYDSTVAYQDDSVGAKSESSDKDKSTMNDIEVPTIDHDRNTAETVAIHRESGRETSLASASMSDGSISSNNDKVKLDTTGVSNSIAVLESSESWDKFEPQEMKIAGRGRGISLLPAWMTSQQGEKTTDVKLENPPTLSKEDQEQQLHGISKSSVDANSVGSGRGRGVNLLPAWMTSGISDAQSSVTSIVHEEEDKIGSTSKLDQAELDDFLESCMTESTEEVKQKQEQLSKANKRKLEEMIEEEKLEKKLVKEAAAKEKAEESQSRETLAKILTKGKGSYAADTARTAKKLLSILISKGHLLTSEETDALISCDILCDAICSHIEKSSAEKLQRRNEAEQAVEVISRNSTNSSSSRLLSSLAVYGDDKSSNSNRGAKKHKLKYGPG